MSLSTAMDIGRSALTASQLGLQVAGNNMANVSTPGYSRQIVGLAPIAAPGPGSAADRDGACTSRASTGRSTRR